MTGNPDFKKADISKAMEAFAKDNGLGFSNGVFTKATTKVEGLLLDVMKIEKKEDLLKCHGPYRFLDEKTWRSYYIPCAESPGVYLIFNEKGKALYVGQTKKHIGVRVADHRGDYQCQIAKGEIKGDGIPEYVIAIPFEEGMADLIKDFENYFLETYSFKDNTHGNT